MALVIVLTLLVGIISGFFLCVLVDPRRKLVRQNSTLRAALAVKDKEIEALRLGLPWYNLGE